MGNWGIPSPSLSGLNFYAELDSSVPFQVAGSGARGVAERRGRAARLHRALPSHR